MDNAFRLHAPQVGDDHIRLGDEFLAGGVGLQVFIGKGLRWINLANGLERFLLMAQKIETDMTMVHLCFLPYGLLTGNTRAEAYALFMSPRTMNMSKFIEKRTEPRRIAAGFSGTGAEAHE